MNEYLLLNFVHIVAFAYWLGGDLGTFFASNQVVNTSNSAESRQVALKVMLACDMGPKLAMPLMFPLGLQMAAMSGIVSVPDAALIALWLLAAYWFTSVLLIYLKEGSALATRLAAIDLNFRIVVVLGLAGWALLNLFSEGSIGADWVAWKILIFAALVACGIGIRINLKPFMPAFVAMVTEGASEASDKAMTQSIAKCRPFVWCIWAGLFVNTALGTRLIG